MRRRGHPRDVNTGGLKRAARPPTTGRWLTCTVALWAALAANGGCSQIAAFFGGAPTDAKRPEGDVSADGDALVSSDAATDVDLLDLDASMTDGFDADASPACSTKAAALATSFGVNALAYSPDQRIGFAVGIDAGGSLVQVAAFDACSPAMKILFTHSFKPPGLTALRVDAALVWNSATTIALCVGGWGTQLPANTEYFVGCLDSTGTSLGGQTTYSDRFAPTRTFLATTSDYVLGAAASSSASNFVTVATTSTVSSATATRVVVGSASRGSSAFVAFARAAPTQLAYREFDASCLAGLSTCATTTTVVLGAAAMGNVLFVAEGDVGTWIGTGQLSTIVALSVKLSVNVADTPALLNLDGVVDAATFAGNPQRLYLLGRRVGGTNYLAHLDGARRNIVNYTDKLGTTTYSALASRDNSALLLGSNENSKGLVARCPLDGCNLSVLPIPAPAP